MMGMWKVAAVSAHQTRNRALQG
ncbi:MAG: hypothetical protein HW380_3852, partial [Magnetococcales bacterium]|nr:hypothetical protein [Magnetococcales bacterium]MBF8273009.1 hypothetical protein [Magnetococcales bacterium]MBF8273132.1 hypothetical protein [Magnetococcales bacterium]MBF8274747.1 hypothetical protein [Magnetococcales bacterium]